MRWQDNAHSSIRHPSGQSTTDQIANSFANATTQCCISTYTNAIRVAVLLVAGTVTPSWVAADAFLDIIKQEVHAVEVDPVTRHSVNGTPQPRNEKPAANPTAATASNNQADVPVKMTQAAFEEHLAKHYVGSFSFYRRLTPEKKAEVYAAYTDRPEIKFIREKIKQTYLNR